MISLLTFRSLLGLISGFLCLAFASAGFANPTKPPPPAMSMPAQSRAPLIQTSIVDSILGRPLSTPERRLLTILLEGSFSDDKKRIEAFDHAVDYLQTLEPAEWIQFLQSLFANKFHGLEIPEGTVDKALLKFELAEDLRRAVFDLIEFNIASNDLKVLFEITTLFRKYVQTRNQWQWTEILPVADLLVAVKLARRVFQHLSHVPDLEVEAGNFEIPSDSEEKVRAIAASLKDLPIFDATIGARLKQSTLGYMQFLQLTRLLFRNLREKVKDQSWSSLNRDQAVTLELKLLELDPIRLLEEIVPQVFVQSPGDTIPLAEMINLAAALKNLTTSQGEKYEEIIAALSFLQQWAIRQVGIGASLPILERCRELIVDHHVQFDSGTDRDQWFIALRGSLPSLEEPSMFSIPDHFEPELIHHLRILRQAEALPSITALLNVWQRIQFRPIHWNELVGFSNNPAEAVRAALRRHLDGIQLEIEQTLPRGGQIGDEVHRFMEPLVAEISDWSEQLLAIQVQMQIDFADLKWSLGDDVLKERLTQTWEQIQGWEALTWDNMNIRTQAVSDHIRASQALFREVTQAAGRMTSAVDRSKSQIQNLMGFPDLSALADLDPAEMVGFSLRWGENLTRLLTNSFHVTTPAAVKVEFMKKFEEILVKAIRILQAAATSLSQSPQLSLPYKPYEIVLREIIHGYYQQVPFELFKPILHDLLNIGVRDANDVLRVVIINSGPALQKWFQGVAREITLGPELAMLLEVVENDLKASSWEWVHQNLSNRIPWLYPDLFVDFGRQALGVGSMFENYPATFLWQGEPTPVAVRFERPTVPIWLPVETKIFETLAIEIRNKLGTESGLIRQIDHIISVFLEHIADERDVEATFHHQNEMAQLNPIGRRRVRGSNYWRELRVPPVYDQRAAQHGVLIMGLVQNSQKADAFFKNNPVDFRRSMEWLVSIILERVFFSQAPTHADPHLGNELVEVINRLEIYPTITHHLLDFGMVIRLAPDLQRFFFLTAIGLASENENMVVEAIAESIGQHLGQEVLHQVVVETLAHAREKNEPPALDALLPALVTAGAFVPKEVVKLGRLMSTLDQLLTLSSSPVRTDGILSQLLVKHLGQASFLIRREIAPGLCLEFPLKGRDIIPVIGASIKVACRRLFVPKENL